VAIRHLGELFANTCITARYASLSPKLRGCMATKNSPQIRCAEVFRKSGARPDTPLGPIKTPPRGLSPPTIAARPSDLVAITGRLDELFELISKLLIRVDWIMSSLKARRRIKHREARQLSFNFHETDVNQRNTSGTSR
jgi:hypothetical protein